MFSLVIIGIFIILFLLFKRNYNRFAFGLSERPPYFLWVITQYVNFKGWSTEEYCLSTKHIESDGTSGYLSDKDIPYRVQSRPKMLRAIPNRQLTQPAPDEIMYEMYKYMKSISIPRYSGGTRNDQLILRGKSVVEHTGAEGLFIPNADQKSFLKGEVSHIHSNDGSFHMNLHPSDAKLLIEKKWAERFPLAGRTLFHIVLPSSYVFVYAPQNEDELKISKIILHAAIDYNRAKQKKH